MAKQAVAAIQHGGILLPAVEVISYNVELKDDEGFIGDRASKGAFREFIENWRKPMREERKRRLRSRRNAWTHS
jgi:hypothetical protein